MHHLGENEDRIIIMALFFFLLFVSSFSYKEVCVCFFKAYPGVAALGHPIPFLSFSADLTSRATSSCSRSSDERSSLIPRNRSSRGLPSPL